MQSPYRWNLAWVDVGVRRWRLSARESGELLGFVRGGKVGEADAWAAVVLADDGTEVHEGWFDHWSKAKRRVVEVVELQSYIASIDETEEATTP